ncbi:MAG: biopolymer transporter ExbB, partial [Planctomycetota bacterium]
AFASSLLGLAGSLVVGLLELFASHGQNRFYRELEDWLSTITRIGFAGDDGTGAGDAGAISQLAEHMAERLDAMQAFYAEAANRREAEDDKVGMLANAVSRLADRMGEGTLNDSSDPETQARLVRALETLAESGGQGTDAESRMRLRSMDVQMLRILEELSAGRQETLGELRTDIAALTDAVKDLTLSASGRY